MSTTLRTFNHTMLEFFDELSLTFDDVPQIQLYKNALPGMLEQNDRAALEFFMNATKAHGEKIMAKDSSLFDEDAIDLGMNLRLSDLWHAEGLDDDSRNAIWNYLSSLFILGTTIQSLDDNMLQSIENLANQTAQQIKEQGSMDMSAILPGLMQSVGGILGSGAGGGTDPNDPGFQNIVQSVLGGMNLSGMKNMLPQADDDDDMPDAHV